jgi:hypothetical protein
MTTYQTALAWRDRGVSTIPICARSKVPAIPSWMPYTERLPTVAEIRAWFDGMAYNIAVITGRGLVILDWDDMAAYHTWYASLNGTQEMAETFTVRTSRGLHLYYRAAEDTRSAHGAGWDVKAHHGYCLTAPSIHPSGAEYRVTSRLPIRRIEAIGDLLPDYAAAIEEQDLQAARARDPLAAAMRVPTAGIDGPVDWERIKAQIPWTSLLGRIVRRGNRLHANCPLHPDTHASFVVYPDDHGHCFGCDWHGDQVDLYAVLHRLTVGEAIKELM